MRSERKRTGIVDGYRYTLYGEPENQLKQLGERALKLDAELTRRNTDRKEEEWLWKKDKRQWRQEEWNWKQELQRRRDDVLKNPYTSLYPVFLTLVPERTFPGQFSDTPFSGGELELLLATLTKFSQSERRIRVPSWPTTCRIGRQPEQGLTASTLSRHTYEVFNSMVVSKVHAEIWCGQGARIWIKDLRSTHGTFVNGVSLSLPGEASVLPHELRVNDIVHFCKALYEETDSGIDEFPMSGYKVQQIGLASTGGAMSPVVAEDSGSEAPETPKRKRH